MEKKADTLQKWVLKNFEEQDVMARFVENMPAPSKDDVSSWMKDLDSEVIENA